jgi:acyl-CoA hydrolase
MFCDAFVAMYEKGKITNARKSYDVNKSTYSFCLGTQQTYDFLDLNPRCASTAVIHTNDPGRVALQDRMIAINNILEIDLLSQVCSETYACGRYPVRAGSWTLLSGISFQGRQRHFGLFFHL